jgi:hypothetical protein
VTGQLRPCSGGPPRRPLPTRSARPGAPARPRIRGSPGGCPGRAQPRTPPAHPTPGIFQPTPSAQMCPPIRALIVGTATNSRAESLAGPRIRTPAISRIPASWTRIPARLSAGHQPSDRQPSDPSLRTPAFGPQPSDPSLRTPAFGPQPSDPSLRRPPRRPPQTPAPPPAPSHPSLNQPRRTASIAHPARASALTAHARRTNPSSRHSRPLSPSVPASAATGRIAHVIPAFPGFPDRREFGVMRRRHVSPIAAKRSSAIP